MKSYKDFFKEARSEWSEFDKKEQAIIKKEMKRMKGYNDDINANFSSFVIDEYSDGNELSIYITKEYYKKAKDDTTFIYRIYTEIHSEDGFDIPQEDELSKPFKNSDLKQLSKIIRGQV